MTEEILTIDDVSLPISQFPEELIELVRIYKMWEDELAQKKLEVFKQEAALRGLKDEITFRLKDLKF